MFQLEYELSQIYDCWENLENLSKTSIFEGNSIEKLRFVGEFWKSVQIVDFWAKFHNHIQLKIMICGKIPKNPSKSSIFKANSIERPWNLSLD